jgi:hypothetical protein
MAIDWRVFLDAVKCELARVFQANAVTRLLPPPSTSGGTAAAGPPRLEADSPADRVRLGDGSPAKIGRMVIVRPGLTRGPRLAGTLIAIAVDQSGEPRLVVAFLTNLSHPAGCHWLSCGNIDPAHCFSAIPRAVEPIPPEQETAGQASQYMIVPPLREP